MSVTVKKFGHSANNKIFVRLDTDKLEKIEKQLSIQYAAQIGVLGEKAGGRTAGKENSELSNADIGLVHEKGMPSKNIPRRSFLEVPLTTKLPGLIGKVIPILKKLDIVEAYKKLAAIGEGVVLQAFPTSGYGTWALLGRGKLDKRGRHTIIETGPSHLIKTGQLRQSINSRVVTK